jgi:undecaprenyl-diphosphatase
MTRRLVPWPRVAVAIAVASAAGVAAIGVAVHDETGPIWFDHRVVRAINHGVPFWVQDAVLHLTDPALVVGVLAAAAAVAIALRRWNVLALVVLVPSVAVVLTEVILKPAIHRTKGLGSLAYPSGHETGLASLVCVLGLILLSSGLHAAYKVLGTAVLVVVGLAGGVALVGRYLHYATDTIGAIGVALSVTLVVGLLIDLVTGRFAPPMNVATARQRASAGQSEISG